MSTVQSSQQTVATHSNENLHRLAVEAGKYLGLSVGEPLPVTEIVQQGLANGYDEREVRSILQSEGYGSAESVPVPPQGDAFGELWRSHTSEEATLSPEVQAFREWLSVSRQKRQTEYEDGTHQHPVEHAYSLKTAAKRSAQAKDVDRHFIEEHNTFTTVLVTYCAEKGASEPIHQHASKFYPAALSRTRYQIFNRKIETDEWAGCRMLAPERPSESAPTPAFTHGHSVFWVEGHHSREDFAPLRETFLSEVEGATPDMNPLDDMIQVQHHTSAEIESHESVQREALDAERGPTTSASGEIGANLPLLRARNALRERDAPQQEWAAADASDCPDWIEIWAAHLCCGEDGEPDTRGLSRWGTFGSFTEMANLMQESRESVKTRVGVREPDKDNASTHTLPGEWANILSETEQHFVSEYVAADLPTDRNTIEANVRRNVDKFGSAGVNTEQVVRVIQAVGEPETSMPFAQQ